MTPFESALELSRHTAEDPSIANAIGRVNDARAARNFDLMSQQTASNLAQSRDSNRLQQEADIKEAERQRQRNEGAASLFATVQQKHPDFTPDPKKSLEENIASAQKLRGDDVLSAAQPIADALKQEGDEKNKVLNKYGAFQPADPNLVNRQLVMDPTLTTGHFPVLGPKEIAMLNSGASPEDVAKTFNLTSNQTALLNAAQTARGTIQQRQQQIAQEKGQVELAGIQDKYAIYHNLSNSFLSNISQNSPDRLGEAAALFAKAATPNGAATPQLNPDGTLKLLNPGASLPPNPGAPSIGNLPASSDPRLNTADIKARRNVFQASKNNEVALQAQVDALGHQLDTGDDPTGEVSAAYLKAKQDLAKAQSTSADHLKKGMAAQGPAFAQSVGYFPGGSNWPANMPAPSTNNQLGAIGSQGGMNQNVVTPPGNVSLVPPNAGAPAPQPQPGQQDPTQLMNTVAMKQRLTTLFGTADPNVFQAAGNYAAQNQGTSPQQSHATLVAAINGDPDAIQKVKQAVAAVTAGQGQQQTTPDSTDLGVPPMVAPTAQPAAQPVTF